MDAHAPASEYELRQLDTLLFDAAALLTAVDRDILANRHLTPPLVHLKPPFLQHYVPDTDELLKNIKFSDSSLIIAEL